MLGKYRLTLLTPITQLVLVPLIALTISLPCVAGNAQSPNAPIILIMGDSLSAGFGIKISEDWASLLEQRLVSENLPYRVVNASISGETTNGGLSRLTQALKTHRPKIVILELGANDGLRGLPLYLMRNNLSLMIEQCQQANTRVLLLGMRLPPNYGPRYNHDFSQIFAELAAEYETGLVPFFLAGVATQPELMQSDGLHPTAAAQAQLLETIWPQLLPLLKN
jgi:acyl-CoA thioesterase-1